MKIEAIKSLTKSKGKSMSWLASKMGMNTATLYRKINRGGGTITLDEADAMKKALEMDNETARDYIFGE